ncbi:MFS transporter [Streptomyces sp. NBC_01210]|nr:MFS transporter [Streptomyces sp. NBC_01210]
MLVAQSMVAAINLLIPQLAASALDLTDTQILWAVDAYVIVFAALLITAGALGDRLGRKGALLCGLGLFAAGAATSALATVPAVLIAGRGLCGAGAALITPATMSILVSLAGPQRTAQALATWTLAVGLGGLAGNLGGGLVGQYLSWRALFWAMVPLAALLALAVARTTPRTPAHSAAALDPLGSLLLTVALVAVVYGIIEGPSYGWSSAHVLTAFAVGAVLLTLFTVHALRAERPLFDPRVFASRRLRAGALGTAASFFGLFSLFYVNAQYLQYAKGFSVALTGVAIVPLTVGMALVPKLGARWQARFGPRPLVGGGLGLIGAGLLLVSMADTGTPYPLYALYLLVLSAGMGLCAPALTVTVVAELPAHQAGLGSGTGVYSVTKGAAHLVVALLVQDGVLELDREVAHYWPEFAAEGKDRLTLRELIGHRAGVIGVDGGFTIEELADDRVLAARLAGQRPYWEPGTAYGYHALVIGALTGEVVRRVTGRSIQELYEERVRAPYGLDLHLGLPEALEARYADVLPMQPTPEQLAELQAGAPDPESLMGIAFGLNATPPTDLVELANTRAVRALGQASAGGVGNARGVAGLFAAAISEVDGRVALLKSDTVAEFARLYAVGTDLVTGDQDTFGLGFQALGQRYSFLGAEAFGHSGAAGALGFADPGSGIAYGYVRRRYAFPGGAAAENDRLAASVVRAAVAA